MSAVKLFATKLVNKSILRIRGPESFSYLQLFLTNDIRNLIGGEGGRKHCIYSHLLNTNGRTLVDLFVYKPFSEPVERSLTRNLVLAPFHIDTFATGGYETDELLLECPSSLAAALNRMLFAMKIRRKLTIESYDMDIWSVYPANPVTRDDIDLEEVSSPDFVLGRDPRLRRLGYRILSRVPIETIADLSRMLSLGERELVQRSVLQYQSRLHSLGVGEGPDDHPHGFAYPIECNADILNGMSFMKGMHAGDWVCGRNVRYGISNRLLPVTLCNHEKDKGMVLPAGSSLLSPDGTHMGGIRSMSGKNGLALLNWKRMTRERTGVWQLVHEMTGYRLETRIPAWWRQGVAGLPAGHARRFLVPEHLPHRLE